MAMTRQRTSKKSGSHRARRRTTDEPVVVRAQRANDITPIEARIFTRDFRLVDQPNGIDLEASTAVTNCPGCDWCTDRERNGSVETPHRWPDPDLLVLSISLEGTEHLGSFNGYITANQLHHLIDHLSSLRDRMVADGALSPRGAK